MKRQLGVWLLLLICLNALLWCQTGTSRIAGYVSDPTGAMLTGTKITAVNEGTNVSLTTTTSAAGTYSFESMPPGAYTIKVEMRGFKSYISTQNSLTIGQPMTVNATLSVGASNENITVVASAEAVQTSTSGNFGNLVDQVAVTDLPIVTVRGRNPLQLVDFQPGVVVGSNAGGGVHVHGARDRAWNYTLDGVDVNETSSGGGDFTPIRTNPDMLAEFRVVTGNPTADIGRASGGQVAMVTRSGTNELHGGAFFFYQTPGLNANTYGNKVQALPRDQFIQKIGGFSLGGPIWKNKTFFFGNFQFLRAFHTQKVTRYVLTQQARQGLFRYVINPAGCGGEDAAACPYNQPAGGEGASVDSAGNAIVPVGTYDIGLNDPAGLGLDSRIQDFIGLTPPPNNYTVGDGLNIAGYSWIPAEKEVQNDYLVKIDHNFNDRQSIFVRWASGHQNTNGDIVNLGQPAFPGLPNWVNTQRTPRNLAINWRWTPNDHSTNELVLGMNRFIFNFANGDPHANTNPPYFLNYMYNFDGLASAPIHNDAGNLRALTTYQLTDNFSFARGAHTFRWGGQVLYARHIDDRGSIGIYNANPMVYFDTGTNPVDPTTFGLPSDINGEFDLPNLRSEVNDLLGRVGAIDIGFVSKGDQWQAPGTWFNFDSRFPEYDLYFQDNWKVKPNLVIDAGLRWEIKMSPSNPHNQILRPNQPMIFGAAATNNVSWVPGKLYDDQWKNLGPSVGFAWDPFKDGKTSVRGNYRLAFDRLNTFVISAYIIQNLPGLTYSMENTLFGQNGGRLADGLPAFSPTESPTSLRTPPSFSTNYTTVMDPNISTPKTQMWGLGIQRELPHKLVLELNYIGRHGTSLFGGYDSNAHEIFKNGFLDAFNTLRAGGESVLVNQLLAHYSGLGEGQTPSQFIQENYSGSLSRNSIGTIAKFINQALDNNGNQLIATNGFSPYFFTPFPQFADEVDVLDTHDYSNYHAFEAQLQRRFSNGLQFQISYTLAKSLDTRSYDPTFTTVPTGSYQSSSSIPFDNGRRSFNYARSDFDRRHALQGNWVWELPFGKGRQWARNLHPVVDRIVGGWGLSGIVTIQSGRPFTVYSGAYTYNDTVMTPASCPSGCSPNMGHLNWQGGAPYSPDASLNYFTPEQMDLFTQPAAGQLSNLGRNYFNLPMNFNLDMAISKRFDITEKHTLQLRLEIQNLTNSVIHDIPANSRITSTSFGDMLNGDIFNNQRRMQLSAKYSF